MKHRIKFYGKADLSATWNLNAIESYYENWEERSSDQNINSMLELFNVQKFIDADMRLTNWDDEKYASFKNQCKAIPGILGKYCSAISDAEFLSIFQDVDSNYSDDFWELICKYKVYTRVSAETMKNLMDTHEHAVWNIIVHRVLSECFGVVIAEHLCSNSNTAEKLISYFLAANERSKDQFHFPAEFSQQMRDQVLWDYTNRETANINYLQLLGQAQSTREFPVSDKLKLNARRKQRTLSEKVFEHSIGMEYGAEVAFVSIPDGSADESARDNIACCYYSKEWIEEHQDYPTLLNNFIYLFKYVNRYFRCSFVSRSSELGVFERFLGVKGKKDYAIGVAFHERQILSTAQMVIYCRELKRYAIRLEDVFKWFFEEYLESDFHVCGFTYTPPSSGTTYAEKCKLLASSIDGILKQFRLYCEEGCIDRELLEISSGHIVFSSLPSLIPKKYAYSNSKELQDEMLLLFSDQSMMNSTPKTKCDYSTLPSILLSEEMTRKDFESYQQNNLNWLIARGAVIEGHGGVLKPNRIRIGILLDLYSNEVVCPPYFGTQITNCVDSLIASNDLCYESTLFSKSEQDYLNYMLNKAEFSNGLDLRNKYIHDTCSLDEKTQMQDYFELLKIMVLIVIKINEEFCKRPQQQN